MAIGGHSRARGYCIWVRQKNRHFQYSLPLVYGPSLSTVACGTRRDFPPYRSPGRHESRVNFRRLLARPARAATAAGPRGARHRLTRIQGMLMRPVVETVTVMVRPEDV